MVTIVDKRFTPKDGAVINRQKFMKRYKTKIKEAVKKNIADQSIKDFKFKGQKVRIKGSDGDIELPEFELDREDGIFEGVSVGNKKYNKGDQISKPPKSGGLGPGGSNQPGENDDYEFELSEKEFLEIFFEDLELPEMTKKNFIGETYEIQRMGFSNRGGPASLNLFQTMRRAIVRILALEQQNEEDIKAGLITEEEKRQFVLEESDLKYNFRDRVDLPSSKAVMFCLMDISGSMGSTEKDIAKRFFILLNRFLRKNYKTVDVVFVRHAEWADECDEDTFFYGRESGGTIISTGYEKILQIIGQRYNPEQWNIYIAQATDGDNYESDNESVTMLLTKYLLPITQYFSFIEIASARRSGMRSDVFTLLEKISGSHKNLVVKGIEAYNQILDIFRSIFTKGKK